MTRIFLSLAILANIAMIASLILGLRIGDPMTLNGRDTVVNARIGSHMLIGLGALTSTTLVHAILLTYFMGTGRWLEETSAAYSLPRDWHRLNQRIKYSTLPGIVTCFLLVLATGCFGAVADPATALSLEPSLGISDSTLHFSFAVFTWLVNVAVNFTQYIAIARNSAIVEAVLAEVRRIRIENGLPVEATPL